MHLGLATVHIRLASYPDRTCTLFGFAQPTRDMPWPHNLYLETLAQQGLVGIGCLLLLLGAGLTTAVKTFRRAAVDERRVSAAALAGLLGFCVAAFVELTLLRLWVVVMLFVYSGVIANLDWRIRLLSTPG